MAAPDSVMIVTNNSASALWAGGILIPAGQPQSYAKALIAGAVADINFMVAFVAGDLSVSINGIGVPVATPAMVAFFIAIAIGDIVP